MKYMNVEDGCMWSEWRFLVHVLETSDHATLRISAAPQNHNFYICLSYILKTYFDETFVKADVDKFPLINGHEQCL